MYVYIIYVLSYIYIYSCIHVCVLMWDSPNAINLGFHPDTFKVCSNRFQGREPKSTHESWVKIGYPT
jgi:hypothetical protein